MKLITAKELRKLQEINAVEREVENILKGAQQWAMNNPSSRVYRQYAVYPSAEVVDMLCELGYSVDLFDERKEKDELHFGIEIKW